MSHENPVFFQVISCWVRFSEVPKTVNSIIVKYHYNLKLFSMLNILKCNLFLWGLNFQHPLLPVFSVTWTFRKYSKMLIYVQETFLIIINVKKTMFIFVETVIHMQICTSTNRSLWIDHCFIAWLHNKYNWLVKFSP